MGREFELKYAATAEQLAAIRAQYGPFETIAMETTYYDTPDGHLRQRHWTLRRRLENGVSVCTVKTPRADGSRGEWQIECPEAAQAVDALVAAGAPAELLAYSEFVPTCGVRFTRLAAEILWKESRLELALDAGEFLGGGKMEPFCEVEVELKHGADAQAAEFANALAAQYGLTPQPESKQQRAGKLAKR